MTVRRRLAPLLGLLVPGLAFAQGTSGDPADRLDARGSPTDRYLEPDELRATLNAASEAFFDCFRKAAAEAASGLDLALTFTVQRDGRAEPVLVEGPASPVLAGCLATALRALEFGTHDGPPLEASYPLVYSVDARGARILPYPVVFTRPRRLRLPWLELPPTVSPGAIVLLERVLLEGAAPPDPAPADSAPPDGAPSDAAPADRGPGGGR